ncbi:MAG: DUF3592 domain-containing protein [Planctomycetota bacterium]|nr:MAG: DUF3592 domain-containing protein [Planctomycetota bacterium]
MTGNSPPSGKPVGSVTKIVTTMVLLLFIGGGVYLTQRGLKSVEESFAATSWPTTEGVIVRSAVHTTETPIKKNGREVPNKKTKSYAPSIEYRFSVKGQALTGTRVTIDDESIGTKASAQAIVDKYPVHKGVKVSYQPDQPMISVLEPGSWAGSYRWFLPGGAFLLIPLLLLRGIWGSPSEPPLAEVTADENHLARPRLLNGVLMVEEIARWEPGQTVHIRRARVGFLKSIIAAILMGLVLGMFLGLLPAAYFLSGRGIIFIAKFYLAVSAALTLASAIGLILYGRRREYLFDWALGSVHWEIGWSGQEAPLESIEKLTMHLPAADSPRNPVVDSHSITATIQGKSYTLLETNGQGLSWQQTRERLKLSISQLAKALQIPWSEQQARSVNPR